MKKLTITIVSMKEGWVVEPEVSDYDSQSSHPSRAFGKSSVDAALVVARRIMREWEASR